ncbi:MAG: ERCC4 domain-containing protein [Burkholderiales bacterium]|nr:ERCC4 domain-containing protein [Burkholderiales bacterium]
MLWAVRARHGWPGPGANVFCLRERGLDPAEPLVEVERAPVQAFVRLRQKLTVTLGRPQRKRCEFPLLTRPLKDGTGVYEQIFFRTESAIRAHKTRGRVELGRAAGLEVAIDSAERYPWSFPGARVERRKLPAGDYALVKAGCILAVAERKTLDNLLTDFGALKALHQTLAGLGAFARAALVVEAQYADFLDESKLRQWPARHAARVLAEIAALHPRLPIVFAGNRKLANAWVQAWFAAVAAEAQAGAPLALEEAVARYEAVPADGGLDERIRAAALHGFPPRSPSRSWRPRSPKRPRPACGACSRRCARPG